MALQETMNRSCVIKPHHAGLFSMINKVITCAELYPSWHVDWRGGTLYSEPGQDLWAALFEHNGPQVDASSPEVDTITEYPNQRYTYKDAALLYGPGILSQRMALNKIWRSFEVQPGLVARAFNYASDHFIANHAPHKVIGALVRADTHAGEQTSDKSQALQDYATAITDWVGRQSFYGKKPALYLVAGDLETVAWFKEHLVGIDVLCHPATKRLATRATDRHLTEKQTLADAEQVMIEVMLLSLCSAMVHPISNMATAALYMNPILQSIYLP
jgi:hypothetical protein